MSNKPINAKDFTKAGWPTGAILESALEIATTLQREGMSKKETLNRLNHVRQAPPIISATRI